MAHLYKLNWFFFLNMKVMVNVLQPSDCHFSVRILFETGKASDIWISFCSEIQYLSSQVSSIERELSSQEGRAHTGNIYIFSDQDWVKPFRITAVVLPLHNVHVPDLGQHLQKYLMIDQTNWFRKYYIYIFPERSKAQFPIPLLLYVWFIQGYWYIWLFSYKYSIFYLCSNKKYYVHHEPWIIQCYFATQKAYSFWWNFLPM